MKSFFNIVNLRGTIFIPQIVFDWAFVSELLKILPHYIPTNNTVPSININGVVVNNPNSSDWTFGTQDGTERLIFQSQKIDFIISKEVAYSEEEIKRFSQKCNQIFSKVLELKNTKASRIAIAPTFKYTGDNNTLKSFIRKIFVYKTFKDSMLDTCDFSQVYRIDEKLGRDTYRINYLSRFYTSGNIVVINGINTLQEFNFVDFDINTFVDPAYSFDAELIESFFSKSTEFCYSFMSFYFDE